MKRDAVLATLLLTASPALAQPPEAAPGTPATLSANLRARFVAQAPDETVRSVADVVFDDRRGIKSDVVSVGGFLGLNAKSVAVAPETLQLTHRDGGRLDAVIDTDKDQLRAAPEYAYLGSEPTKK